MLIQDRQLIDIVHLDRVEFVPEYSGARYNLRFCYLFHHVLFGFISACNFDTLNVLPVSRHLLAYALGGVGTQRCA